MTKIYISAPFTSKIENGEIVQSYRELLTKIRKTLRELGFDTHLPHEDVAHWRKDTINNSDAFLKNLEYVDWSDVLLGIVEETSRGGT